MGPQVPNLITAQSLVCVCINTTRVSPFSLHSYIVMSNHVVHVKMNSINIQSAHAQTCVYRFLLLSFLCLYPPLCPQATQRPGH